jgi:hypothetical protein
MEGRVPWHKPMGEKGRPWRNEDAALLQRTGEQVSDGVRHSSITHKSGCLRGQMERQEVEGGR